MTLMESVFIGIAIGDAFGVGLEACDRKWLQANVNFENYVSYRTAQYSIGYRLGDYSDDTSDTLAIAKLLTLGPKFTVETLYDSLKEEWMVSKVSRDGIPRAGFGSIKKVFDGEITLKALQDWQRQRPYPGNAPTMRSIPLGFLPLNLIQSYCEINANVTHPNPKAIASSLAIAYATKSYLDCEENPCPKDELLKACADIVETCDPETADYFRKVDQLPSILQEKDYEILLGPQPIPDFMRDGYRIHGLNSDAMRTAGATLYILKHTCGPFEALRRSIYMGGDVDSLAALTVGISSGKHGFSELPYRLIAELENYHYVKQIARNFEDKLVSLKG